MMWIRRAVGGSIVCLLGCSWFAVGCDSPTQSYQQASALSQSGLTSLVVPTRMAMLTAPNANCALHFGDPKNKLELGADPRGIVRFEVGVIPSQGPIWPILDCRNEAGQSLGRQIADDTAIIQEGDDASPATRAAAASSAGGTLRPPLQGDPLAPTQGELFRQGYPFRPDPVLDPDGYASWLWIVSEPYTRVPLRGFPSGIPAGPSTSADSLVWSGIALDNPGTAYDVAFGSWAVPTAWGNVK
jgi:hypothetical protein